MSESNVATKNEVAGFVIRNVTLDDAPAIARMLTETAALDGNADGTTEAEMRERLSQPNHDPSRDRWLVEEPGNPARVIASASVFKPKLSPSGFLNVVVHPDWRNRGLGSALLKLALTRARELGATHMRTWADVKQPFATRFAEENGFAFQGYDVDMRAPAEVELAEPQLPAGYTVRTYAEVQDPEVMLVAENRGFIGHHEHTEATLEQMQHWLAEEGMRPDGIFLAFGPAGEVAGICWTLIEAARSARRGVPTGFIASLAVLPEHRRAGLGRALLLTGMRWLRSQGMGPIELDAWGENERALPLYTGVGFGIFRQVGEYRIELT